MKSKLAGISWGRYAGFVLLNVGMAVYGTYAIIQGVKPVASDLAMFVIPMACLSTIVFVVLYPILRRLSPGLPRFGALYLAFLATLILMPFSWLTITAAKSLLLFLQANTSPEMAMATPACPADAPCPPTPPVPFITQFVQGLQSLLGTILLMLSFGHFFGFPALIGIAAVNKLFSPLFFPRKMVTG